MSFSKKWSVPVGKQHKNPGYLKLNLVAEHSTIYNADASGLVQAVSSSTGRIKWSNQLKHSLGSGPSVGEDVLAVGAENASLIILNKNTGVEQWQASLSGELLSPPTITHDKVVAKTIDGTVYAFDSKTGKKIWAVEHSSPSLVLKASSSPVVVGNLVLIGFPDGKLDALDIDSGRLVWQRSIAYSSGASDVERLVDIDSDPIVKNHIAYISSYQGYVGALSLDTGEFLWRRPASVYKNMLLSEHDLYLTDSNDVVWSINPSSGQVNWKQIQLKARTLTNPVYFAHDVVVGDKMGYVHFIDTQTGELIGRVNLSGGITIAPIVFGSSLYVVTNNGLLERWIVN
jgi:outer membrane protein assembly factor BamB